MDQTIVMLTGLSRENEKRVTALLSELGCTAQATVDPAASAEGSAAPLVILDAGAGDDAAFERLARLKRKLPQSRIILLGAAKSADVILRAMRGGATEFVVEGDDADLRRAVKELQTAQEARRGTVTTVFPAKGGVGATALATNLAGALVEGARVCLLDLDLHFGDVLSFLDLQAGYSISDVATNMRRLDRELLDSSVTRHKSGVYVLAQGDKLDATEPFGTGELGTLLGFLRRHYDHIVIDGVHGFEELALAALDASDRILLVATQDVPAVRNAQRSLEIFGRLGYTEAKIDLVLNRYQRHSRIDMQLVADTVGRPVAATLANDFVSLIRAINHGVMLAEEAPRSKLARDILRLAPLARGEPAVRDKSRSLLTGLFGALGSQANASG